LSQVIVTNDKLKPKREKSRQQERGIEREEEFARWRMNDVTGKDAFAALVGYGVTPILALWGLLMGAMAVMLGIERVLFRGLGKLIGGKKSLIRE
jgi:hypothetical protein